MNALDMKYWAELGLTPVARNIPIPPNWITVSALGVMAVAGLCLGGGVMPWAGALILASGFLDLLDGAVARATDRATPFGALLDRVLDRAGDFVIISAVVLGGHVDLWLGLFVMSTVLLASYISACLEAAIGSRVGEKLSLRAVRLVVIALACFAGRIQLGMLLLAIIGSGAVVFRLSRSYKMLLPGHTSLH